MRLLAIETSSAIAGLALFDDGIAVREDSFLAGMTLCQQLPGRLQALLGCERLLDAGLTGLAVSLGPGSFTSLRVGLALAKAVAHRLALPLMGVPSPEVIAAGLPADAGTRVAVVQHARADEVYLSLLVAGKPEGPTAGASLAEAIERLRGFGAEIVVGDGAARHSERLRTELQGIALAADEYHHPTGASLARIAATRIGSADPTAAFSLAPQYVMPSQAERALASTGGATR
jgi:tRNA threonylcarbamoyladenosine biosynthesis protein TsaB